MEKRIFFKLFLAAIPILIMGMFYLCTDPFMVLYHYDSFYSDKKKHLEVNEDYASTEIFLSTYPQKKYDSYIFGSSRSRYFTPAIWSKHIGSEATYNYGVAMESLYGIAGKVNFLHKRGAKIKNALIIIDADLLAVQTDSKGHLFQKHPLISGTSMADFQFSCFMDFFSIKALTLYIKLLTKPKSRDVQQSADASIEMNRDAYYQARNEIFYKRDTLQHYSKPVIEAGQEKMLMGIKKVFDNDGTDYRIVIPPLYDQKKMDTTDLRILCSIFGKKKVYDFSGINDISENMYNYYDAAHFRPIIAYRIMDSVYTMRIQ